MENRKILYIMKNYLKTLLIFLVPFSVFGLFYLISERSLSAQVLGTNKKITLMDIPSNKHIGDTVYAEHMNGGGGWDKWYEYRSSPINTHCIKVILIR